MKKLIILLCGVIFTANLFAQSDWRHPANSPLPKNFFGNWIEHTIPLSNGNVLCSGFVPTSIGGSNHVHLFEFGPAGITAPLGATVTPSNQFTNTPVHGMVEMRSGSVFIYGYFSAVGSTQLSDTGHVILSSPGIYTQMNMGNFDIRGLYPFLAPTISGGVMWRDTLLIGMQARLVDLRTNQSQLAVLASWHSSRGVLPFISGVDAPPANGVQIVHMLVVGDTLYIPSYDYVPSGSPELYLYRCDLARRQWLPKIMLSDADPYASIAGIAVNPQQDSIMLCGRFYRNGDTTLLLRFGPGDTTAHDADTSGRLLPGRYETLGVDYSHGFYVVGLEYGPPPYTRSGTAKLAHGSVRFVGDVRGIPRGTFTIGADVFLHGSQHVWLPCDSSQTLSVLGSECQPLHYQPDTVLNVHHEEVANLGVYPNPVRSGEQLFIQTPDGWQDLYQVAVVGVEGKVTPLLPQKTEAGCVVETNLPAGVYFLRVSDGYHSENKKIIIVH